MDRKNGGHTVHVPVTDEEWVQYKILCLTEGSTISQDLADYVRSRAVRKGVSNKGRN